MAIAHVLDRAEAFTDTDLSAVPVALTSAGGITVGNHLILCFVAQGNTTVNSITDPRSNTWQIDVAQANGTVEKVTIASCKVDNAYTNGDALTVNLSATATSSVWTVDEFSDLAATSWLDKTAVNAGATSTARDSGTTATLSQADELCVAAFGEGVGSGNTWTSPTAGWSLLSALTHRSTTPIRGLKVTRIIVAATTAQNFTVTSQSTPWSGVIATYKAAASGTTHFGATALSAVVAAVTAATRSTFGSVSLTETIGVTTVGRLTARGATTLPLTLTTTMVGKRSTSGTVSLTANVDISTAGIRTRFATVTAPIVFTATTAGSVQSTKFGATSLPLTLSRATVGKLTAKAVVSRPIVVGITTAGFRVPINYFGAASLTLTVSRTTVGKATFKAATSSAFTLNRTTVGKLTAKASSTRILTFAATTAGTRTRFGAVSRTQVFTFTTVGRASKTGAASLTLSFATGTVGTLGAFGSSTLPIVVSIDTAGTGSAMLDEVLTGWVAAAVAGRTASATSGRISTPTAGSIA